MHNLYLTVDEKPLDVEGNWAKQEVANIENKIASGAKDNPAKPALSKRGFELDSPECQKFKDFNNGKGRAIYHENYSPYGISGMFEPDTGNLIVTSDAISVVETFKHKLSHA